ncbi:MAG: CPBP family intramembrane metalloprotease [Pyrinomonadaceae bacterium]|nr:CPBP family intramembrane metalloprotease [Pyrinomonadaceae bacterium]
MKSLTSIFYGPDGRLRSGWRALVFVFAFRVTALISGTVGYAALNSVGIEMRSWASLFLVANGFISLVPALLVGWACGKLLEDLPYKALGAAFSRHWFVNFISGNVLGFATLGLAVGIAMIFGGMKFELNGSGGWRALFVSLISSFLVFAAASAFEEALFRGYILQTFARSGLAPLAIGITSVFFGAVHAGNPNAGTISTINTVIAGIWFGVAYLKTRDLWFVWGLHLMWNFAQGSVFGIEVSGMHDLVTMPLMKEIDSGPLWLTGETYGIEGGIACTVALIVSGLVIHYAPFPKPDIEMLALTEPPKPDVT